MTAIRARGEVDAGRTLRLAVPCDLPPGPVEVLVQVPDANGGQIPPDTAAAMASLERLTDEELWRAARNRLAEEFSSRTEELHHKRQREGLTAEEKQEEANLVRAFENILLIRAKAAELLRTRGHDVSGLLGP